MYIHRLQRVSHTSLRRNRRVNLDVENASRHEATRAHNERLASSLPPSFLFLFSFLFVSGIALSRTRSIVHSLFRRFYLRENSKGDGQLRRWCSLTGRRRDATTRRLKSRLRRSEFLLYIPSPLPRTSKPCEDFVSRFSPFQLPDSCFSCFHSHAVIPFSRISRNSREKYCVEL